MRIIIVISCAIIQFSISVFGQNTYKGILLYKQDSAPVQYAAVKLINNSTYTETNEKGQFSFVIPDGLKTIEIEVFAINLREKAYAKVNFEKTNKVFVNKPSYSVNTVNITGLTAKDVLIKAIEKIPENYTDSSFAAFSFYRQYQIVDNKFRNFIEAQAVIFFKVSIKNKFLKIDYGFDIEEMRRSEIVFAIDDFKYDVNEFERLFESNTVFHLQRSMLDPGLLNYYDIKFDSLSNENEYVINYTCKDFSNDDHGVSNFKELNHAGEGWEQAIITIDKQSFAIKRIERNSFRNKNYNYPFNNNFILPSRNYYGEFIRGNLLVEYKEVNKKWFPKTITRSYSTDIFQAKTSKKHCSLTDVQEWHCDSVSHYISPIYFEKFFSSVSLPLLEYTYNKEKWSITTPSFMYHNKEEVVKEIEVR